MDALGSRGKSLVPPLHGVYNALDRTVTNTAVDVTIQQHMNNPFQLATTRSGRPPPLFTPVILTRGALSVLFAVNSYLVCSTPMLSSVFLIVAYRCKRICTCGGSNFWAARDKELAAITSCHLSLPVKANVHALTSAFIRRTHAHV